MIILFPITGHSRVENLKNYDPTNSIQTKSKVASMLLTRTAAQIPPPVQETTQNVEENNQHFQAIPGPSAFKCLFNDCPETFNSSARLELHIQEEHSDMELMSPNSSNEFEDDEEEEVVCYSQKGKREESPPRIESHNCPFLSCKEKFTSKIDLMKHTEEFHPRKDKGKIFTCSVQQFLIEQR